MTAEHPAGKALLDIARRHLRYVSGDKALGIDNRREKTFGVYDFYLALFRNVGMIAEEQRLHEIFEEEESVSPIESRKQDRFYLNDILQELGIKENILVFDILENSGIEFCCEDPKKGFVLTAQDVEGLVGYLHSHHAISYFKLKGESR